jgi:hypothetical protein
MKLSHQNEPSLQKQVVIVPVKKKEHIDFIRDIFDGEKGKPIKINRHEPVGRFIFSHREYSSKPVCQNIPPGYTAVEIEFPCQENSSHENHFCYFSIEAVTQINDFVSAWFDLYFHTYFFDTCDIERDEKNGEFENIEITRDMLIESFITGLDMDDYSRANETMKKRELRAAIKGLARKHNKLLRKDYNFRKKIYMKRKNNLKHILFQKHTNNKNN